MARLIDADRLKNAIRAEPWKPDNYIQRAVEYVCEDIVDEAPTVDAVEVVRCKDCKHMIAQSHTRYCTVWHGTNGMGDEGFCNYGERR